MVDAAKIMRDHEISRLVVTDDNDKICGILSFGKILRNHADSAEMTEVIAFATNRKEERFQEGNTSAVKARRAH